MWDKQKVKHLLLFNGCLLAAAIAVATYMILLYRFDFPFVCSFSEASHLYCPGCGFTRATRALLSLDILSSLAAHPFALLGVLAIGYYEVALFRAARGKGRVMAWPAVAFAFGLLCFFLLRNLLLILFGVDTLGNFGQEWGILAR